MSLSQPQPSQQQKFSVDSQNTGGTGGTDKTGTTPELAGDDQDEEEETPVPWSCGYLMACVLLPIANGLLSKSFWPCFPLYYVQMQWPLWRCGLSISLGVLVKWLSQRTMETLGYWTVIPICLTHLTFASLAIAFFAEEWAIFMEMVVWLGLDAVVAVEGVPYLYFEEQHKGFGDQASTSIVSALTLGGILSFALGGIIYEYCGWTGMAIFHVSAQSIITLLLLAMPPLWKSLMKQFAGRDAERPLQPVLPDSDHKDSIASVKPHKDQMRASEGTEMLPLPGVVEEEGSAGSSPTPERTRESRPMNSIRQSIATNNTAKSGKSGAPVVRHGRTTRVSRMSYGTRGSAELGRQSTKGSVTIGRMFTQSISTRTTFRVDMDQHRQSAWSKHGTEVNIIDFDSEFVKDKELRMSFAYRSKLSPFAPSGLVPDLRFPLFLVVLCNGAMYYSLLAELASFALLLAQFWSTSTALWAGLAQSGGEVLAMILGMLKSAWEASLPEEDDEDEDGVDDFRRRGAVSRCLSFLNTEPYNVSLHIFFFALSSYCFIIPHPAGLVVAQLFVSSCYGFAAQSAQDVYVLYCCMSNPELLYTVMRLGYSAEVFGGLCAGVLTLSLITMAEIPIPFIISGSICLLIGLIYTIGFCHRVGTDMMTAEADRA